MFTISVLFTVTALGPVLRMVGPEGRSRRASYRTTVLHAAAMSARVAVTLLHVRLVLRILPLATYGRRNPAKGRAANTSLVTQAQGSGILSATCSECSVPSR
jgi:hypothetical protein